LQGDTDVIALDDKTKSLRRESVAQCCFQRCVLCIERHDRLRRDTGQLERDRIERDAGAREVAQRVDKFRERHSVELDRLDWVR